MESLANTPGLSHILLDFKLGALVAQTRVVQVVHAEWLSQSRHPVVLKIYQKSSMSSSRRQAARREARIQRLAHALAVPNTCALYGMLEDANHIVLVMEHCEGGDLLEALLKRGCALSERQACRRIILPMLAALAKLHAHGIAHRDCKLENIFLTKNSNVRLGDYGVSCCLQEETISMQVGTIEYWAPEVAALPTVDEVRQGRVNPAEVHRTGTAVDIWALGVCLYGLVSGTTPFVSQNKDEIRRAILDYELLPLPDSVSPEARDFIAATLTYDSKMRPTAFMLAHHPFVRKHCTREDILSMAPTPSHPFNHIAWDTSPLTTFHLPATLVSALRSSTASLVSALGSSAASLPLTEYQVARMSGNAASAGPVHAAPESLAMRSCSVGSFASATSCQAVVNSQHVERLAREAQANAIGCSPLRPVSADSPTGEASPLRPPSADVDAGASGLAEESPMRMWTPPPSFAGGELPALDSCSLVSSAGVPMVGAER